MGFEAKAQGATRHERGLNAFKVARALAQTRGWPFNWRLVEVPGMGHRAKKMLVRNGETKVVPRTAGPT